MKELKPLPCPHCGITDVEIAFGDDEMYSVDCGDCAMRGPAERNPDSAKREWNFLPRALRWTTDQPKVAGWYWWRWAKFQEHTCIEVRDGLIVEHPRKQLRDADEIGGEWAGPIPPPLD